MANNRGIVETYDKSEEREYSKTYLFIKGFAYGKKFNQTLKALALARVLHDGQHRNGGAPYIIHPLKVCSTLISLGIRDDEMLAASLLHDVVEDCKTYFPEGGTELISKYKFSKNVYDIVMLLTKEDNHTDEYAREYFNKIKLDVRALLIKLADRSHNSETLYVMKLERMRRYIIETRTWIYDLCKYGKMHYPEYSNELTILKSKIASLCNASEILVNKYEAIIEELPKDAKTLNAISCYNEYKKKTPEEEQVDFMSFASNQYKDKTIMYNLLSETAYNEYLNFVE